MTPEELSNWWKHLPVKRLPNTPKEWATKEEVMNAPYPECTAAWNRLEQNEQEMLYTRFGERDAHGHHKAKKGNGSLT